MKKETAERNVPLNDLDAQQMNIEPDWSGRQTGDKTDMVVGYVEVEDEDGNVHDVTVKKDLLKLLDIFKKDIRLGNLKRKWGELDLVRYDLSLAKDCLDHGFVESAVVIMGDVAAMIDSSQSDNGFLRTALGTFTHHKIEETRDEKRGLFGGKKE